MCMPNRRETGSNRTNYKRIPSALNGNMASQDLLRVGNPSKIVSNEEN